MREIFVRERKSRGKTTDECTEKGTDCDYNLLGFKSARGPLFERDLDAWAEYGMRIVQFIAARFSAKMALT